MNGNNDSFDIGEPGAHIPVLLKETVAALSPQDGETYLDCTFGGGGHTAAILRAADCKVVAVDRDPRAAARAEKTREIFGESFEFFPMKFSEIDTLPYGGFAGVLFDFGVSSFQLDDGSRGFSISKPAVPDMRMDDTRGESAMDFIMRAGEREISQVLRDFGEERLHAKIARAIAAARDCGKIATTTDLAEVVASACPRAFGARPRIHPATKTFQALRIKVNDELAQISEALPKAFSALKNGGKLVAISFHSLEDRIVKQFFKKMAGRPQSRADRSFLQDRVKLAELASSKPIVASEDEISKNPRSRSAKLRAITKY